MQASVLSLLFLLRWLVIFTIEKITMEKITIATVTKSLKLCCCMIKISSDFLWRSLVNLWKSSENVRKQLSDLQTKIIKKTSLIKYAHLSVCFQVFPPEICNLYAQPYGTNSIVVEVLNKIKVALIHPVGVCGRTHACTQTLLTREGWSGKRQSKVNYSTKILNSQ